MSKLFILSIGFILSLAACSSNMNTQAIRPNTSQPMKQINPDVAVKMRENTRSAMNAPVQEMGEPTQFMGMIAAHNYWRNRVNVPALIWSSTLANVAQQWANQLQSLGCPMQHSRNNYGENLASFSNMNASPQIVAGMWADERVDYNYNNNSCRAGKQCGHYTQMVWRETKELGCGVASCGNEQIWVCNYAPAGNYVGQSPY
ncbi:MAG: hypothetical protein RL368_1386 [Pseudomonadota bacterium]|jgi:uncharacterized protein YkwD